MGVRLSIDKHVSNLHELLEMSAQYFQKVRFASKISDDIKQHLKIWRFQEDNSKFDAVKSAPVPLSQLQQHNSFQFSPKESYLCLFIYQGAYAGLGQGQEQSLPVNLVPVLQSSLNMLTAESLDRIVSTNESEQVLSARGFLTGSASVGRGNNNAGASAQSANEEEFKYILFVWDGIETSPLTKANALAKAVELQTLFSKAKDAVLKVLFSGGVIRGKKLQRGSVYVMSDLIDSNKNLQSQNQVATQRVDPQELKTLYDRILLLKCIFQQPSAPVVNPLEGRKASQPFQKLRELFSAESSSVSYWNRFDTVGTSQDGPGAASVVGNTQSTMMVKPNVPTLGVRKKPQIPTLGPNLGKLGFTDLKNDDEEVSTEQANQPMKEPTQAKSKPMGLGLNLANVQRDVEEEQKVPAMNMPSQKKGVPAMNLGQLAHADAQMHDESQPKPGAQGSNKIPSLNMGGVKQQSSEQQSLPAKPKIGGLGLGLGLDLSKAQQLQQEHLTMAEEKKSHARETAGLHMGGLNNLANQAQRVSQQQQNNQGRVSANQTPDQDISGSSQQEQDQEFGTPSSQGQGESYRDSSAAHYGVESRSYRLENMQIAPERLNDEDFDYRGTSRKEYENEFYKNICSEVIPDFLYLGGDLKAKDAKVFEKFGITHVINCAADYSDDYHKDKGVIYKSYHLKDHNKEDIACVFYDAIQFLKDCRAQGGKCYVHCVQGISRSATICIAYKILTEGITYLEGLQQVKACRACINPNMQFTGQLMLFEKRLRDPNFYTHMANPRVYSVMSHQENDPQRIVCKLMTQSYYQSGSRYCGLDPRGMSIIQTEHKLYLWVGAECLSANQTAYMSQAMHHTQLLIQYEQADSNLIIVNQGEEDSSFWQAFGLEEKPSNPYTHHPDFNHLYIDLSKNRSVVRNTVVQQMDEYKDEVQQEKQIKPKLFNYPEWDSPVAVFDFEDLENEEAMLVLCVRKAEDMEYRDEHVCYVWTGPAFSTEDYDESDLDENQFVQKCIDQYWGGDCNFDKRLVKIVQEEPDQPSEAFQHFFD